MKIYRNYNCLVTGANGFIGRHLVKKLRSLNMNVFPVDNFSTSLKSDVTEELIFNIDVNSEEFVNHFIKYNFDFIFHFGAPCSVIQFNSEPVKCVRTTVHGFNNVLKIARHSSRCCSVVYPSSGNVYGDNGKEVQIESNETKPQNLYAVAKLACEDLASESIVKSLGLRIFAGYGPGEKAKNFLASAVSLFLFDMLEDKSPVVWGNGCQTRDFVYIDDIVKCIVNGAGIAEKDIVNVGSGTSFSFNEIISILNELLGKNIVPTYVDKPINYVENTKADITLMKEGLQVNPLSLREGLKRYLSVI